MINPAYLVPCPKCYVDRGESCVTSEKEKTGPHKERFYEFTLQLEKGMIKLPPFWD